MDERSDILKAALTTQVKAYFKMITIVRSDEVQYFDLKTAVSHPVILPTNARKKKAQWKSEVNRSKRK